MKKTKEQCFEEFKRLWFTEHRLPQQRKEYSLYKWYKYNKDKYQPLIDFCREQGIDIGRKTKTTEQLFEDFKRFWFTEHRLPQSKKEYSLYKWYKYNKDKYQPLIDFCREQGIDTSRKRKTAEQNFEEFKRFWFTEQRLPQYGKEHNLYEWYNKNKDTYQPLIDFIREQGIDISTNTEKCFEDFKRFWFREHRLPQQLKEMSLYLWYYKNKDKYKPLKDFLVLIEAEKRGIPGAQEILETIKTRGGY